MPIALGERADRRVAAGLSTTPASVLEDWHEYQSSGSVTSRNRLVTYYMKNHVRPIAARLHAGLPRHVELDDLVQQGYFGLVDAMDRFELDRETRFETFSRRRIFGAIQDYLRSIDTVPRLARMRSKQMEAIDERFRKEHGRPPTDDELRPLLGLPEPIFHRVVGTGRPAAVISFSGVSPDADEVQGDSDAMHAFEDHGQTDPLHPVARLDLQRWLTSGFERRDRLIIVLYYYEQMTMLEIGRAIGISESRVSQRLESIIGCLKARLGKEEALA